MRHPWVVHKRAIEISDFYIDCSLVLEEDMKITEVSLTLPEPSGLDVIGSSWADGERVAIWLSGGTPGVDYHMTARVLMAGGGRLKELVQPIVVKVERGEP